MSASLEVGTAPARPRAALGVFERYLTVWVALCMAAGIALGALRWRGVSQPPCVPLAGDQRTPYGHQDPRAPQRAGGGGAPWGATGGAVGCGAGAGAPGGPSRTMPPPL